MVQMTPEFLAVAGGSCAGVVLLGRAGLRKFVPPFPALGSSRLCQLQQDLVVLWDVWLGVNERKF